MQERPSWAPASVDLDRPNAARVYDYFLGGACNFEQDRVFAEKVLAIMPEAREASRLNRAFLRRAVRFCVTNGIDQFLDLGSGIPTAGNVHEIAQQASADTKVVYVDLEPVAVTHSELLLADNVNAGIVHADLCDVDTVLGSPITRDLIDFSRPVAVMLVSVLHFVPPEAGAQAAVARYVEMMAPGSFLAISHGTADPRSEKTGETSQLYKRSTTPGVNRSRAEIEAFFAGTELVEPGLVWTPQWHPDSPEDVGEHPEESIVLAGVGRKV